MLSASDEFARQVREGGPTRVQITSWLGTRRLATLPVMSSWSVSDAEDDRVPGFTRFDVPASDDMRATHPGHPLAAFGQQVHIRAGYGTELLPLGWYQLTEPTVAGDVYQCEGQGLLQLVRQARFLEPFGVGGVTRTWTLRRLTQGILPIVFEGVTDELVESAVWEQERIDALWDVVEAWPARIYLDGRTLVVTTPWDDSNPGSPVVTISDGPGGTLTRIDPTRTNDRTYNAYVVSTLPADPTRESISERWVMPDGPMRWGGPYGYRTGYYSSPLLKPDRTVLRRVAETMTRRSVRRKDALEWSSTPDYRIERGDVIRVRSARHGINVVGRVTSITHTRTSTSGTVSYLSGVR